MIHSSKIIRNSMYLSLQPLLLNFISLFVVGYIARKLGKADFGIFNFVTAFTMLFYPLAVLGLNRITVRDLSSLKAPQDYAQQMFALRFGIVVIATSIIIIVAKMAGYPDRTNFAIYLASLIFFSQLVSETFTDVFNASQKMEFTALTSLVSGLTLTILSVVVLYLGYGLYELLGVYAFGQALGLGLAVVLITKCFFKIRLRFNWTFSSNKLLEGSQFFLMTMMWFVMTRIDTVFLSKQISMEQLGLYTASMLLVTKLMIIPQAISGALLPAFSQAYSLGDMDGISKIWGSLVSKILLFAIPFILSVSIFSNEVITIVFGAQYAEANIVLKIGILSFLFTCVTFCEFSLLTAIRKQKFMLYSYIASGIYCIITNLILIKKFHSIGAVIAFTTTQFLIFIFFTLITVRFISTFLPWHSLVKLVVLNLFYFFIFDSF